MPCPQENRRRVPPSRCLGKSIGVRLEPPGAESILHSTGKSSLMLRLWRCCRCRLCEAHVPSLLHHDFDQAWLSRRFCSTHSCPSKFFSITMTGMYQTQSQTVRPKTLNPAGNSNPSSPPVGPESTRSLRARVQHNTGRSATNQMAKVPGQRTSNCFCGLSDYTLTGVVCECLHASALA